jgi:hypothetical protein
MSQNKELKRSVAELQDAFVKLSNQNMDLASDLDTERRRTAYLRTQLATPTPPRETTPIPVVDAESVSTAPSHVGSPLVQVEATPTSAQEATPTPAQTLSISTPATPTLTVRATPMDLESGVDEAGLGEGPKDGEVEVRVAGTQGCRSKGFLALLLQHW